jgi:hypothetical protein
MAPPSTDIATEAPSGPLRSSTADLVKVASGWYLLNRLVGTIALFLSAQLVGARWGWSELLSTGDGNFYLGISKYGYFDLPTNAEAGERVFSSIGFFPLLPALIRGFDAVLPGGAIVAGTVVCTLAGWAACVAVTLLAREMYDGHAARRAAALIACFPGAFIFSFIYTEGLLVASVAAALILLRRRLWVWAGVAGAIATLSRPSGIAIVAAAAVVAIVEIRRNRTWPALWAPVIAASGMASFLAYLGWRTGEPLAWFDNQRDFWHQRNNLGGYLIKWAQVPFQSGFKPTDHRIYAFILLALIPVLVGFYRRPPGVAITVYVSVSLFITLTSSLGPRPRFLLAAFPLLLPFAAHWKGQRHTALVAIGFGLVALSVVYYAAGVPLSIEHFNFEGPVP